MRVVRNHCFGVKPAVMPPPLLSLLIDGLRSYTATHNARKFPHSEKNMKKKKQKNINFIHTF